MQQLQLRKKSAAAFLALSFLLTGCVKDQARKSTAPDNSTQKDSKTNDHAAADLSDAQSPGDTDASAADSEPEAMLLERDVPLPDAIGKKETAVSLVLNGKQGVELFSRDKKNHIYQYILTDDNWKRQELRFPDQIRESAGLDRLEMLRGEDGRYYAFYALSDETYHLQATDDLHTFEDLTPPQWKELPGAKHYVIPTKVQVTQNSVLCALIKYEDLCRLYDLKNDGEILHEFASYPNMEVCGDQILCETIDRKGSFVYDLEKKEHTLELSGGLTNNAVYEMRSLDEMYACNDNGIYHLSSGKWQLLVDSSLNSLSDPNLSWQCIQHNKERIYISFLPAQSLAEGKHKEGFQLKYYEYSTDIPHMDRTMTIWGLEENATIKNTLAQFRKEHPNIRVVYEIASATSGVMTTDDQIRQFNAGLFAGNGPDVILMDGLHPNTYAERGLLYDLSEDLADCRQELLPGVQTLFAEHPYMIPLRTVVPFVIGQTDLMDDSLEQFLTKSSGKRTAELLPEEIFTICSRFFTEGLALNKADLSKQELVSFLELCKKASAAWPRNDSLTHSFSCTSGSGWEEIGMGKTDFTFSYAYGLNQFCNMLDTIGQLSEQGFSIHCAANSFVPHSVLAVSTQSPNRDLAVAFIQKALEQELQQSDFSDGFPVNSKALDAWADRQSNMMVAVSNVSGDYFDTKWPSPEILTPFLTSVKEAAQPVFIERYALDLIQSEAVKVISGDTSAEDAAGRILNQLELYYDE